ncbi:GNAT family N-acetyltransferase [Glaciibacter flavus]|uniref:GNAT family N-acetyltransferase n=1 Tax=Orlajensenia flava TaxID=2565934 RepID=UPI003AFF737A
MTAVSLRRAVGSDSRFLTDMVVEAANWNYSAARQRISVLADPAYRRYVSGWQRPSDVGVVATDAEGAPIGACWFRLFPSNAPGHGFVGVGVPELILGVSPIWRAQGVGRALLRETVSLARQSGYRQLALSVEQANHAMALYRSEGFITVSTPGSRETMVRNLS